MFAMIPPAGWDEMAGPHFYSSGAWLRLCDSWSGCSTGVVINARGAASVAVPVTKHAGQPPTLYRWNDLLRGVGLPSLRASGILVGPDQGYQTHFLRAGEDSAAALSATLSDLQEQRRAVRDQACVAMYLSTSDVRAVRAAGLLTPPVLLETDAWFDLPDGGWSAWLDMLPSKRRVSIRREVRAFTDAGYSIEHCTLAECCEELGTLAAATQGKYGTAKRPTDYVATFRRHIAAMGDRAQVSLCRRDGVAAGFCLYYRHGDTINLRWAGFDYDRLVQAGEYFNLVYYDHVVRSPAMGVRRLHAGIRATQAKALRGARLAPLWLLDLDEDSPLRSEERSIRRHNAAALARLTDDPRTRNSLDEMRDWLDFC